MSGRGSEVKRYRDVSKARILTLRASGTRHMLRWRGSHRDAQPTNVFNHILKTYSVQCRAFCLTLSIFYTLEFFINFPRVLILSLSTGGTPSLLPSLSIFKFTPPRCSEVPVISIYVFSDELLLRIFCHYQPFLFDEYGADDEDTLEVTKWDSERWWYKLAHVCRKWRHLVLASASHMGLSIVCSYATPVAAILTHLPSLPLIIDYGDEDRRVASDDEEGILIALRNHLQVRRIRIRMSSSGLQRLFVAMDAEFPILEHLYIKSLTDDDSGLSFPQTFKAPQLRHFRLRNIAYSPATFRSLSPNTPVQPAKQIGEYARRSSSQPRKYVAVFMYLPAC